VTAWQCLASCYRSGPRHTGPVSAIVTVNSDCVKCSVNRILLFSWISPSARSTYCLSCDGQVMELEAMYWTAAWIIASAVLNGPIGECREASILKKKPASLTDAEPLNKTMGSGSRSLWTEISNILVLFRMSIKKDFCESMVALKLSTVHKECLEMECSAGSIALTLHSWMQGSV